MRSGSIALLLVCVLRHQLWALFCGARQLDDRTVGLRPCQSLLEAASPGGLQLRYRNVSSLSGCSEQETRLTSAHRGHELLFRPFLRPCCAVCTGLAKMCCYNSRCWIQKNPLRTFNDGSTYSQPTSSRRGAGPKQPKLPAAAKCTLSSCRPRAQGAQSGRPLSGTSLRSSTTAYDEIYPLDGIIPVIKPEGPTSGDVCLQIAKLRQQHWEQVLQKSSRQVKVSGMQTDCVVEGTDGKPDKAYGIASKKRRGVGHGGTLDPAASGVLVLAIGKGTKLLHRFLTGSKGYRAVVKLGISTDTLDASGVTTDTCDWSHVSKSLLRRTIKSFIGKQLQQPPLYSAKRVRGVRMYHIAHGLRQLQRPPDARAVPLLDQQSEPALSSEVTARNSAPSSLVTLAPRAVTTEEPTIRLQRSIATTVTECGDHNSTRRPPRDTQFCLQDATRHGKCLLLKELPQPCEVEIYDAKLVEASNYELPFFEMEVYCSKGTYIRQLAADIAARCHTVAHVVELTRVYQAPFHLHDCVPLAQLDLATLRRRLLRADTVSKLIQQKHKTHSGEGSGGFSSCKLHGV